MDIKGYDFAIRSKKLRRDPLGLLHVTGEDAKSFLQGQWSQDINTASVERAAYGYWLNQKGKVFGDAWVRAQSEGGYLLASWSMTADAVRDRLEAYLIADEVEIEDVSRDWRAWCVGAEMRVTGEGAWCAGFADDEPWQWIVAQEEPPELMAIADGVAGDFARARIANMWPEVPTDLGEEDLPQEGGRHEAGVSFTKGCYLGQEVMARIAATGRVRRRLVRVQGAGAPPDASELWQGGRVVAELRSRVVGTEDDWLGLAMVSLGRVDIAQSATMGEDGPPVHFVADAD